MRRVCSSIGIHTLPTRGSGTLVEVAVLFARVSGRSLGRWESCPLGRGLFSSVFVDSRRSHCTYFVRFDKLFARDERVFCGLLRGPSPDWIEVQQALDKVDKGGPLCHLCAI